MSEHRVEGIRQEDPMELITVVIADDHTLFRKGLIALLALHDDIRIVGEAGDGVEALSMVETCQPDILLLDIRMPKMSGLEVLPKIRGKSPRTKTLIVSGYFEDEFIIDALRHGAKGYVVKTATLEELHNAIRTTYSGELWAERRVLSQVVEGFLEKNHELNKLRSGLPESLTKREREVVRWVIQGVTNKAIGLQLGISEKTVKAHLGNIFNKLKIHRRLQLLLHQIADRND